MSPHVRLSVGRSVGHNLKFRLFHLKISLYLYEEFKILYFFLKTFFSDFPSLPGHYRVAIGSQPMAVAELNCCTRSQAYTREEKGCYPHLTVPDHPNAQGEDEDFRRWKKKKIFSGTFRYIHVVH